MRGLDQGLTRASKADLQDDHKGRRLDAQARRRGETIESIGPVMAWSLRCPPGTVSPPPSFSKEMRFQCQAFPRNVFAVLWDFKGLQ
jgi:hypothetical protein